MILKNGPKEELLQRLIGLSSSEQIQTCFSNNLCRSADQETIQKLSSHELGERLANSFSHLQNLKKIVFNNPEHLYALCIEMKELKLIRRETLMIPRDNVGRFQPFHAAALLALVKATSATENTLESFQVMGVGLDIFEMFAQQHMLHLLSVFIDLQNLEISFTELKDLPGEEYRGEAVSH